MRSPSLRDLGVDVEPLAVELGLQLAQCGLPLAQLLVAGVLVREAPLERLVVRIHLVLDVAQFARERDGLAVEVVQLALILLQVRLEPAQLLLLGRGVGLAALDALPCVCERLLARCDGALLLGGLAVALGELRGLRLGLLRAVLDVGLLGVQRVLQLGERRLGGRRHLRGGLELLEESLGVVMGLAHLLGELDDAFLGGRHLLGGVLLCDDLTVHVDHLALESAVLLQVDVDGVGQVGELLLRRLELSAEHLEFALECGRRAVDALALFLE